jgi:hypothetical protein
MKIARLVSIALLAMASCTSEAEKRAQAEQATALAKTQAELGAMKAQMAAAEEARKAEEEARKAKAAAEEAERARVTAGETSSAQEPECVHRGRGCPVLQQGIINTYRELTTVSLMNKSKFAVRDVRGTIHWFNEGGGEAAGVEFSVPVSIGRSVPATRRRSRRSRPHSPVRSFRRQRTSTRSRSRSVSLVDQQARGRAAVPTRLPRLPAASGRDRPPKSAK